MSEEIKLTVGQFRYPVNTMKKGNRLYFQYPFNKKLTAELKAMAGAKYHDYDTPEAKALLTRELGSSKVWSVLDIERNRFQLEYLKGGNPYAHYEKPIEVFPANRSILRPHQCEFKSFALTRRRCILAAEMGTGKTLAAIEIIETAIQILASTRARILSPDDVWYVAPRGVLKEIVRQLGEWQALLMPRLMTYEGLVKEMNNWIPGRKCPKIVILDECSRAKTPTADRSRASLALANGARADWGNDCFIILMSGSPAPKAPSDWWMQCEIACPGFLREGDIQKCQQRLAIFDEAESPQGMKFLKRVAWLDDERRCNRCGEFKEHHNHDIMGAVMGAGDFHEWIPSQNEVSKLYQRMDGLVLVKFKKDCVGLPDKQYRIIELKPTPSILRGANAISSRGKSAAQTLILLREFSDGFQYRETVTDEMVKCDVCKGSKRTSDFELKPEFIEASQDPNWQPLDDCWQKVEVECPYCLGTGETPKVIRESEEIPCPKEDALRDLLDEHEDDGRLVVYAGFQASVDRCVRVACSEAWEVIRVDGRGWTMYAPDGSIISGVDFLEVFQKSKEEHPKVCFIGQPGAAGMGLTLTASKSIVYYSNDFNAESRIQSEDRIHRMGMDLNKGATIIDLIHLPTDMLVLNNLKQKRRLQAMTLGDVQKALACSDDAVI